MYCNIFLIIISEDEEARLTGPHAVQTLKCNPTKQLESLVNPSIKTFIWDLLNVLIVPQVNKTSDDIEGELFMNFLKSKLKAFVILSLILVLNV